MTQEELLELMDAQYGEMRAMFAAKNDDYAAAGARDALGDFHEEAEQLGLTPEQVLHVYMSKHWRAITSYCREGKVESEAIEGRLHDILGYTFLLLGLVAERWAEGQEVDPAGVKAIQEAEARGTHKGLRESEKRLKGFR